MKCVKCQTDNKLKERKENNGKCSSCKHEFTFDPKLSDSFTDPFFAKTISAISVNDSLYFTPRQFYYFFNARKYPAKLLWPGFVALGLGIFAFLVLPWALGFIFLAMAIVLWLPQVRNRLRLEFRHEAKFSFEETGKAVNRWVMNNGKIAKLLPPPEISALPTKINEEVTAYSFDRAVICDRTETAHFLIANNFHFENNCAVLTVNGYPQNIFGTVLAMLHRNPELKVYALHDASPSGVQLVHRLRITPTWFANSSGVTIYELGLLPRQLLKRHMFVCRSDESANKAKAMPSAVRDNLQPDELRWLDEGKYVELESLSPMTLLRLLREGIAKSRNPQEDDALVILDGGGGYYGGSDVSVYSVDSFG